MQSSTTISSCVLEMFFIGPKSLYMVMVQVSGSVSSVIVTQTSHRKPWPLINPTAGIQSGWWLSCLWFYPLRTCNASSSKLSTAFSISQSLWPFFWYKSNCWHNEVLHNLDPEYLRDCPFLYSIPLAHPIYISVTSVRSLILIRGSEELGPLCSSTKVMASHNSLT